MHPINFYLSGVISADFPGEASRYVEDLFGDRTVAVFSQGASGDQNPRDFRSPTLIMSQRAALTNGRGPFVQRIGAPPAPDGTSAQGFNDVVFSSSKLFHALSCCKRTSLPSDALVSELQAFVKSRIAPHQYPRRVELVQDLPKHATGKVLRYRLRA
jgi:acyl-CoA synthetase (AMP-forming)/AMP-acid ligase II